ncbi:19681_t:CDS:2, partial [Gigaspora margarita]
MILNKQFVLDGKLKNNSASLNFLEIIQLDSFNLIQDFIVGLEFKPERDDRHLKGPCAIILESIQSFRWIDLNVNNAQAIRDLREEIRDLKRKLVKDREERDNKRNKNNSDKPKPTLPILPPEDNNRPNNNNENNRPNNNNTPTPTTTSNTPITTILSTSTTKELKENEIKKHLKEHIKNPLSKETIHNKLKIKKQSTGFTKIKEIINKITDIRVKEIIEEIQKLIETY